MCNNKAHHRAYLCNVDNNSLKYTIMKQSIVITPHVLNTINALPMEERLAVASALAGELILGSELKDELTPIETMIYRIIRDYIERDSYRFRQAI